MASVTFHVDHYLRFYRNRCNLQSSSTVYCRLVRYSSVQGGLSSSGLTLIVFILSLLLIFLLIFFLGSVVRSLTPSTTNLHRNRTSANGNWQVLAFPITLTLANCSSRKNGAVFVDVMRSYRKWQVLAGLPSMLASDACWEALRLVAF